MAASPILLLRRQYVIARQYLRDYLKEQGRKLSDVPDGMSKEEWKEKLKDNLETVANHQETLELARKRIAARQSATPSTPAALEGINLYNTILLDLCGARSASGSGWSSKPPIPNACASSSTPFAALEANFADLGLTISEGRVWILNKEGLRCRAI